VAVSAGIAALSCLSGTAYGSALVAFTTGATSTSATIYVWNPSTRTATGYSDDLSVAATIPTSVPRQAHAWTCRREAQ
jgi:hypothetical protein